VNGDPRSVLLAPVVSEKSYGMIAERGKYTFRVHPDAHKTQIRQAVEKLFAVGKLAHLAELTGRSLAWMLGQE